MKTFINALIARPLSLTGRLLWGLVVPMSALALLLGLGGALVIEKSVETINDRILSAASRAIAESLAVEDGEITLDLPPSAFGMLENNARDNVYYSIRHKGSVITGYPDLPDISPGELKDGEAVFATTSYRGRGIRIVAEARRLPRVGIVIVQVAETLTARERTANTMLLGLVLLETALIGLSIVLIPVAVRWGLVPLTRLRNEIDQRNGSDFTPLSLANVPKELRDLVRAFNYLLMRLDAAVQGIRRFTADASHQMRTPLSILRTHVAVLRNAAPGSDEAQMSIDDIEHATSRLQHLLVQLLALARADSAIPEHVVLEEVDVADLVRHVASEHASQSLRAEIELHFVEEGETALASTHPVLAEELLSNLLDNAIRYNRPGGSVQVAVKSSARSVRVEIEDDGPGILPEDRERVFSRFTRLDRDRNPTGSGLGLSIAQALSQAIGARIKLHGTASGKGLKATVTFPRTTQRQRQLNDSKMA